MEIAENITWTEEDVYKRQGLYIVSTIFSSLHISYEFLPTESQKGMCFSILLPKDVYKRQKRRWRNLEEMRIYIANLGKYNEGELVGAWFTPPVDFEEVKERIGLKMCIRDRKRPVH